MLLRALALILVLAAATFGAESLRARGMAHYAEAERYEDVYYLPPASALPVLSLGYRRAMADLLWMKSLLYFSDEVRHTGHSRYIYEYAKGMLTLDPHFRRVYAWLAMAGVYRAAEVSPEVLLETVAFLERGFERYPDDGQLAWSIAGTLLYEVKPLLPLGPERDAVNAKGKRYSRLAARLGAGPPWLAASDATELARLGQIERAIEHLESVYAVTSDPGQRAQLDETLWNLAARAEAEGARSQGELLEERRREDFPYLELPLYLLVGPRSLTEPGAVDLAPSR